VSRGGAELAESLTRFVPFSANSASPREKALVLSDLMARASGGHFIRSSHCFIVCHAAFASSLFGYSFWTRSQSA
jgi:hypothetical protein